MPESLVVAAGLVLFVALVVYNIRRRGRMTPSERVAEDQLRETRRLRREMQRRRYD